MSDDAVKKNEVNDAGDKQDNNHVPSWMKMIGLSVGAIVVLCLLAFIWGLGSHAIINIFKASWNLAGG